MPDLPAKQKPSALPNLWTWEGSIGPAPYALTGAALVGIKYAIDCSVAHFLFNRSWEIWNYLLPGQALDLIQLSPADQQFYFVMVMLSLPFMWSGVVLTIRRLRSAGVPVFWAQLFFVPFINVLFFLALCVLPHVEPREINLSALKMDGKEKTSPPIPVPPGQPSHLVSVVKEEKREDGIFAVAATVPPALILTWLCVAFFQAYGGGLFVGLPFMVGMSSAYLFGRKQPKTMGECLAIAMVAITVLGIGIFFLAWEGMICLVMASPIAYFLAALGAMLGYGLQKQTPAKIQQLSLILVLFMSMPVLMGAESMAHAPCPLIALKSAITIDAPPETVWKNVIAFPRLAPPDEPIFKLGIAYPIGATINGHGPGAMRKCNFSTGAFFEPIRVWDEPKLLKFGVVAQPPSMREMSWMHEIQPAHLQGYLDVQGGQFELKPLALPSGKTATRLEGTTWYRNQMWPVSYWRLWSDYIIHTIHMRVLKHIEHQCQLHT